MVAGAHGDRGSIAPEHVEVAWSTPTGSARALCLRMEGSTVRDSEFSTSPATHSHVTTKTVRISMKQFHKTIHTAADSHSSHPTCFIAFMVR